MIVLAGDIGGTKTLLQLSRATPGGREVLYEKRYASTEYGSFLPLVTGFVEEASRHTGVRADSACFGIAGPVNGRQARTTNLPWNIDADELESSLGISPIRLINDFQAIGYGIETLQAADIFTLQEGKEQPHGTRAIIGAGTGLGQCFLVWHDDHYEVIASEGSHAGFSPSDPEQAALLGYLQKRYRWASWERAVSGPGLVNIFDFLADSHHTQAGSALQEAMNREDRAAAISRFGMQDSDPLAARALHMFVSLYGAQAGNLALTGLAAGGIYIAGGIAPKILDKLKDGTFMRAFLDKDERMQPLLKAMPVRVVVNPDVGLLGCAVAASRP